MIRLLSAVTAALLYTTAAMAAEDAPAASGSTPAPAPESVTPAKPFVYTPKDTDIVYGKEDAPVVIVEYASLSCPHCAHFFTHNFPELASQYLDTGKAKLVYRNFPLNDPALKAAELVQCVSADRREAYLKVLFRMQIKWAYDVNYRDALANIAAQGGMDPLKFEACMNDKNVEKAVLAVAKEAADDFKVNSTPTFYINGVEDKGDHDAASMGKIIDAAIAGAKKK